MLKWAKERMRVLAGHRAGQANVISPAHIDAPSSVIIAAEARRVTKRIVAISSTGIEALAGRMKLKAHRPGVQGRWKASDRVAML
jgi:hypothetical protein